jgi:hypothetical protein
MSASSAFVLLWADLGGFLKMAIFAHPLEKVKLGIWTGGKVRI